jgi:hypothetical protein
VACRSFVRAIWWLALTPLFGCVAVEPASTQLQIREFQTRTYPVRDSKLVMKALINALQDEGFIVKHANTELGLISATKETNVENPNFALLMELFGGNEARWRKVAIVECSANVTEFGDETKVRVNFQVKTLDNRGEVMDVRSVSDAEFYRQFFSKVDKSVFIQRQQL